MSRTRVQSVAPRPLSAFCPPVAAAISEENQLRTQGTSFLDSLRRISWCQILFRIVAVFFVQHRAAQWQQAQDEGTIRPRALRWSADGTAVYGGTKERNQLRSELRDAIKKTTRMLKSAPDFESPYAERLSPQAQNQVDNLVVNGRPLLPYVQAVIGRGRELLGKFKSGFSEFRRFDETILGPEVPTIVIDEAGQDVLIEINAVGIEPSSDEGKSESPGPPQEVTSRIVIRMSYRDEVDVRVISVDVCQKVSGSYVEPDKPTPNGGATGTPLIRLDEDSPFQFGNAKKADGDGKGFVQTIEYQEYFSSSELTSAGTKTAFQSPVGKNSGRALQVGPWPSLEVKDYPFFTGLAEAYGRAIGKEPMTCEMMLNLVQEGWEAFPDSTDPKENPARNEAITQLKKEFPSWYLTKNEGDAGAEKTIYRAEDDESRLVDLRIISVVLGMPVVVFSGDTEEESLAAVCYRADGKVTMDKSKEEMAALLGPDKSTALSALWLKNEGSSWEALDRDQAAALLAAREA